MTVSGGSVTSWSAARWARVLDRIEHRCADVGLRFWAPPLWLEVTMTGPDSDRWPRTDGPGKEWNWQSSEPCLLATELGAAGASDEQVLAVVSRYALENLVLNAVHEIGEWFRLDGRRVFPSHPDPARSEDPRTVDDDLDGNGEVHLELGFPGGWTSIPPAVPGAPEGITDRVGTIVAASRFSYLPGTFVSYTTGGPVVTGPGGPGVAWHGAWSSEVLQRAGRAVETEPPDPHDRIVGAVATDVHRALVHYEADRVCRAFHVDGRAVWAVASGRAVELGADELGDPRLQPMTVSVVHTGRSTGAPRSPTGSC